MSQAKTWIKYTGDGVTKNFSQPIVYDSTYSSLKIFINNTLVTSGYTEELGFIKFTSAPSVGATIVFRRSTDTVRKVDFVNSSILDQSILDLDSNQIFALLVEAFEAEGVNLPSSSGVTVVNGDTFITKNEVTNQITEVTNEVTNLTTEVTNLSTKIDSVASEKIYHEYTYMTSGNLGTFVGNKLRINFDMKLKTIVVFSDTSSSTSAIFSVGVVGQTASDTITYTNTTSYSQSSSSTFSEGSYINVRCTTANTALTNVGFVLIFERV